jgi:hypothetical protein
LNDDVDWQVALTSMQYTNRFYEMREPAVLYVAVEFPSIHAINIRTRIEKGVTQYAENLNANSLRAMMRVDQRILKQFLKVADTADSTFVVRINILVPTGHYSDPSAVYKVIVSEFNRLFSGERFGTTMKAVPTGTGSGTELQLEPSTNKLFLLTEHAFLVNTLGMVAKVVDTDASDIPAQWSQHEGVTV